MILITKPTISTEVLCVLSGCMSLDYILSMENYCADLLKKKKNGYRLNNQTGCSIAIYRNNIELDKKIYRLNVLSRTNCCKLCHSLYNNFKNLEVSIILDWKSTLESIASITEDVTSEIKYSFMVKLSYFELRLIEAIKEMDELIVWLKGPLKRLTQTLDNI